jgi:hypothetical protein
MDMSLYRPPAIFNFVESQIRIIDGFLLETVSGAATHLWQLAWQNVTRGFPSEMAPSTRGPICAMLTPIWPPVHNDSTAATMTGSEHE